jgi:hypothetical protein
MAIVPIGFAHFSSVGASFFAPLSEAAPVTGAPAPPGLISNKPWELALIRPEQIKAVINSLNFIFIPPKSINF